ncbi:gamma-glutamylcyclotransferase family protein [Streptomyces californicus]|uniref:gamma-glutamylcyclotransferase family protein n=1 Tax=Streptomyces californicus TaxID=67351 RepID=UPI0037201C3E
MPRDDSGLPRQNLAVAAARLQSHHLGAPLFVYGTLQFDAVLMALIGRVPRQRKASAPGWRIASLEGRVYPGLVAEDGTIADGHLLNDLSTAEGRLLDAFEDDRYRLLDMALTSEENALTYVWEGDGASRESWDAEGFRVHHLERYAERCARLAPTLKARTSPA